MFLTTFTDKDGNRLEKEILVNTFSEVLNKYKDEYHLKENELNENNLLIVGKITLEEIQHQGINPNLSHYLFDKKKKYVDCVAEVIVFHCYLMK